MYTKLLSISIILFGLLFTFSCNKFKPDTLDGELSYLVGTWDWDSTFHRFNWCTGGATIEETIYPEENNFSITFEEEGYVSFSTNDSLLRTEGVTTEFFEEGDGGSRHIVFSLSGDANDVIGGIGTIDKTIFTRFPFQPNDAGCENFSNYFSKR